MPMISCLQLRSVWLSSVLGLLVSLPIVGCGTSPDRDLKGVWVGGPDSAARRAERDAGRFGVEGAVDQERTQSGADSLLPDDPTDWEQFDVEVRLEFGDQRAVTLQLNGGSPVSARWQVVEVGPTSLVIELATDARESLGLDSSRALPGGTESKSSAVSTVRRRFELLTDREEGRLQGFTLSEVGADRRLGTLYFQRAARE